MKKTLIICILFLFSCSKENIILRNDGSDMPILIQGNTSSNVFILFLHGGPGASGFYDEFGKFFSDIENQFAIVYWEQRGSGISQGNAVPETINIPQFFEDIDKVIALIRHLHPDSKIFLMGHSWGGGLGTAYLINKSNSNFNNINGWIEIDGLHNVPKSFQLSKQFVLDHAVQQTRDSYWSNCINWYNNISEEDLMKYPNTDMHADYIDKAGGYWYQSKYNYASFNNIFFSASSGFDFLSNNGYIHEQSIQSYLQSYTQDMSKITLPTSILWGKYDGCIPSPLAQDAYDNIGTSPAEKTLFLFENSGHSPYIEEKALFNQKVVEFINKYK